MLRFYPYYTKNHPFLISKTVFKINNSMIYYLITIVPVGGIKLVHI